MNHSSNLLNTTISKNRIIWIMSDEDADIILSLSRRHLKAAKRLISFNVPREERQAIRCEIEACRRKRQQLLEKYR